MLAMADRYGRISASIPGLAKEAAVSVEACRTAINEFLAPDPDSRTKIAEGRRIEEIDGGWKLINHAKYRAIRDEEERRLYKTIKQREYRSVDNVDKSGHVSTLVDQNGHNAEAEADTEAKTQEPRAKATPSLFVLPDWVPREPWEAWLEVRKKKRAANTVHALDLAVGELERLRDAGENPAAVLDQSTLKSYTGLFPVSQSNGNNHRAAEQPKPRILSRPIQ